MLTLKQSIGIVSLNRTVVFSSTLQFTQGLLYPCTALVFDGVCSDAEFSRSFIKCFDGVCIR
jgi:hypothetical protein